MRSGPLVIIATLCVLVIASTTTAADWPTYRFDPQRSGITGETLKSPLVRAWVYRVPFAPKPAFGKGLPYGTNGGGHAIEGQRIEFDNADGVAVSGGKVFFGSIGDGQVRCLDVKTGRTLWTFQTAGPVRCSPTVWDGKVYVGSDDGCVYCLKASDGSVVWKIRGVPDETRVPGHGSLISIRPCRTGVLVDKGVAYFAAGIFPTSGAFLYAVDAETGRVIWCNDYTCEAPLNRLSPMGYLLADEDRLIVPRGRLNPSIFDRKTGRQIKAGGGGARNTTFQTLAGGVLYNGMGRYIGGRVVVRVTKADPEDRHYLAYTTGAKAFRYPPQGPGPVDAKTGKPRPRRPGQPEQLWSLPVGKGEVALAGDVVVAGGNGKVALIGAADGKPRWSAEVDGTVWALAVAGGRLFVSTDRGAIYCFGPKGTPDHGVVSPTIRHNISVPAKIKQAAKAIVRLAPQAHKGYALVYGVETGELLLELAQHTELKLYGVTDDPKKLSAARVLLERAELWGGRASVELHALDKVPYTKYFANLVVSESAVLTGKLPGTADEMFRMTAPIRGTIVLPAVLKDALPGLTVSGNWASLTRKPLDGAGVWTHAHAGPGGTNSSQDRRVRGPLRLQWFGRPGPDQGPNRHMCASPPLSYGGRMFYCSEADVAAYDIYNGTELWRRDLNPVWRCHTPSFGGNTAVGPEGYFVISHDTCHRLDATTGKSLGAFKVPPGPKGNRRMWGGLMLVDGVLIGTRTIGFAALENNKWTHRRVGNYASAQVSDLLFAMDPDTGKLLWQYAPPGGFLHWNLIAGGGAVYVNHMQVTADGRKAAIAEMDMMIAQLPEGVRAGQAKNLEDRLIAQLEAVETRTGKIKWSRPVDWTICGAMPQRRAKPPRPFAPGLLMYKDDILVQARVAGHKGGLTRGRTGCGAGRNATTGELLWVANLCNANRPLIALDTIYGEPWAHDLKTGAKRMVRHPVTGRSVPLENQRPYKHWGITSASAHIIVGRSEGMGFVDLLRDQGTTHFIAKRANCWVSSIFAGGVALWPIGGAGCQCGLPMQLSVAFVHDDTPRRFSVYCRQDPVRPIERLSANLGSPGDIRGPDGALWLSVPRPPAGMGLPVTTEFFEGGAFARRNGFWTPVAGTKTPWVYTSAARGLKKLSVDARGEQDGPASYTVRLHFAAPPGDKPGVRVFDVVLQDKVVEKGFDIVQVAGADAKPVVLEFEKVKVPGSLAIELRPRDAHPTQKTWPILCGVEMVCE